MANARKECQKIEDEILESMTELDGRTARQPQVEKELQEAKQKTAALIDDLQQRRDRFTGELAEVHKQVQTVEEGLLPDVKTTYIRQKDARGEDALALVENRVCKACYTTITAQNYNDLLANHLVLCKSCGRILYLQETVKSEES
jgi:predicted  nucleic acid-binding Zn-ribbon protein